MLVQPTPSDAIPSSKSDTEADSRHGSKLLSKQHLGILAVLLALLGLVSWLTIPRLPAGICFDDAGDIQLASATLGIAHPPGYAGYATIGFLFTRLIPADPAYVVSVLCFVTGLCALTVCFLLQVHLGLGVWFGAAITLALAAHPRFWTNIRAPEVYMPTLALLVLSTAFLLRYSKVGLRRHLFLAVLCFGVAMGNRPPVLFAAPFFLLAWNYARRPWARPAWRGLGDLTWMIPLVLAPTIYSFVFVYVRDRPDACYNYIELHNEETKVLPPSTDGVQAKLRRAVWQVTGEQFRNYMGADWQAFVGKCRWVRTQIAYAHPFTEAAVFMMISLGIDPPTGSWYPHIDLYILVVLTVLGLIVAFRTCPVTAWLLTGLIVSCLGFVLAYQVFGQAADLLPLLFGGAVAIGALFSKLFPARGHWLRQGSACILAVGAGVLYAREIPHRSLQSTGVNATEYLQELDMATFPGPAVICANWTKSVPMRYAQCVLTPRRDLHIVTSGPEYWMRVAQREEERPVYAANALDSGGICSTESFRNVFRLYCPKPPADPARPP